MKTGLIEMITNRKKLLRGFDFMSRMGFNYVSISVTKDNKYRVLWSDERVFYI